MTAPPAPDLRVAEHVALRAQGIGKRYQLWKSPGARLRYSLLKRAERSVRLLAGDDAAALGPIRRATVGLCERFDALQSVSFSIQPGESVAIIGRNGSGKSTLLQILAGTLRPTFGSVMTHGRIAAMLELGSGFNPEFTGRENVFLNASILGVPRAQTEARFADIEKFADIGVFIDQPVKSYSSGMVVRLAFSVLVHIEPQILIIDEALAVGDFLFQQKCFDHLRQFQARGCTFLFVSHAMSTVLDLCERALLLDKGRLMFDGPAKEAVNLYEGTALQERYEERGPTLRMTGQPAAALAESAPAGAVPPPELLQSRQEAEEMALAEGETADPEIGSLASDSVQLRFTRLYGADGVARDWITSEDEITLSIGILCRVPLHDPHVGFKIRDRLGRVIFETSSLCMGQHVGEVSAGELLVSRFRMPLPVQAGQYSVTVGFANGGVGKSDYQEALLFQHGAKTFEVVRNTHSIIWSGIFNVQPHLVFSRQRVESVDLAATATADLSA